MHSGRFNLFADKPTELLEVHDDQSIFPVCAQHHNRSQVTTFGRRYCLIPPLVESHVSSALTLDRVRLEDDVLTA